MNNSNSSEERANTISLHLSVNYLLTCLFGLIEIVGICGNLLVIASVRLDARMRRSLTNRLIVHVASCDLLILLFNIPDLIQFVSSNHGNWILNQFACQCIRSILVLAQYASVLTMCAVTIERFIGIVYPLRSKFLREKKHVSRITLVVWIFSFVCTSPNLVYLRVVEVSPTRRACFLQYSAASPAEHQRRYIIHKSLETIIFYFLPLLLQIFCYTKIAQQLSHIDQSLQTSFPLIEKRSQVQEDHCDSMDETATRKSTVNESFLHSSNPQLNRSPSSPRHFAHFYSKSTATRSNNNNERYLTVQSKITANALKSRRSVIKMLVVVVLIYFISFSPQVLIFLLFDTNLIRSVPQFIQTPYFLACAMLLVTISSASNPIVYAIFCSKFRQSFAKILRQLFCCAKNTD